MLHSSNNVQPHSTNCLPLFQVDLQHGISADESCKRGQPFLFCSVPKMKIKIKEQFLATEMIEKCVQFQFCHFELKMKRLRHKTSSISKVEIATD